MLTFTTSYPCPIPFVNGGGGGTFGLCAMEAISILTNEYRTNLGPLAYPSTPKPYAAVKSVHPALCDLIVRANDLLSSSVIGPTQRADGLWPILPAVMDTGTITPTYPRDRALTPQESFEFHQLRGFPIQEFASALDVSIGDDAYASPGFVLDKHILPSYSSSDLTDWEVIWNRTLSAVKLGIRLFWEVFPDFQPRTDFTEHEIANLINYLHDNYDNLFLQRKRDLVSA